VENAEGEILWEPKPEKVQVLDAQVARVVVSLLEDVVTQGTGYTGVRLRAGLPPEIPAAGKTGTTNDGTNVWFMGFTPNLMAGVWFGMDTPVTIWEQATGGADASPVWGAFMRRVYFQEGSDSAGESGEPSGGAASEEGEGEPGAAGPLAGSDPRRIFHRAWPLAGLPEPWPVVEGLVTREVDSRTGLLASPWCPEEQAYTEIFLPGTEPKEYCDLSGLLIFRK
jgi:membrane peptidoglycan carboxypeptidase